MKRQRGRGRKPGGGSPGNRPLESNGPDVKIRGTAAQIYEKYSQYARDAQSSGDRVKYENYLQHAEHYFRIMAATMPREQRLQQMGEQAAHANGVDDRDADDASVEADGAKADDAAEDDVLDAAEGDDSDVREDDEAEASAEAGSDAGGQDERGEGRGRNRRRGRRRPVDGERAAGQSAAPDTEARSALDSLARKQGALAGG